MSPDLTINTIVFKKSYDLENKSLRQSIARGVNTPDRLIIQSQDYVDSATKVPGQRFTGRIDRIDIDANLQEITTSCYFVIAVPKTATQAQVDNVLVTFKSFVADVNLMGYILNGEK